MVDTAHIDLLGLIERDTALKRVAGTKGGEYHGPCPLCGGKDRFVVQPNRPEGGRWFCRQCSPKSQDAIAYVMVTENLEFIAACEALRLDLPRERRTSYGRTAARIPRSLQSDGLPPALTDPGWQEAAEAFVRACIGHLPKDQRAYDYLIQRGLTPGVIEAQDLGLNPSTVDARWGEVDVYLPRGIVIPWRIDGRIYRVNMRRPAGEPKYIQPAGSANGLYRADALSVGCIVLLCEGEFDALSVIAGARGIMASANLEPVAMGSTSGSRRSEWIVRLMMADRILVASDADEAGDSASAWWLEILGERAKRLRPMAHDINEMLVKGYDLERWIADGLG